MKTILAALFAALLVTGCAWTVKPGSDPVVVSAEQICKESVAILDDFIKFVDRNPGVGKDVLAARELAATSGPVYIREVRKATKAYKASRTDADRTIVQQRIATLQQLLTMVREQVGKK